MRGAAITAAREEWQAAKSPDDARPFLRLIIDNSWLWPKDKRARRFAEQARRYIVEEGPEPWVDQLARALAACERAIAIEPDYNWGYCLRAGILLWSDRRAEALEAADRAIGLEPNLSWPHWVRAASLLRLGRFDEALVSADNALQILSALQIRSNDEGLASELASAHEIRSGALAGLGDFDQALAAAERAIELDRDYSANAHARRADALAGLGHLEDALKALELACEISPSWSRAHAARAWALSCIGRLEDAVTAIQLTCDLEPEFIRSPEGRELLLRIGESKSSAYTGRHEGPVGDETAILQAASDLLSRIYPRERVEKALGDLAADAARETTSRSATVQPRPPRLHAAEAGENATDERSGGKVGDIAQPTKRPEWKDYKGKMALPDFVKWAYSAEINAGTLNKATLRGDNDLYTDYFNWRRRPNLPADVHWLRDLPTEKEWKAQHPAPEPEPARLEDFNSATQEAVRLYQRTRQRSYRRAHSP
jgi:tetratricopeptide (TPR) repeat protein